MQVECMMSQRLYKSLARSFATHLDTWESLHSAICVIIYGQFTQFKLPRITIPVTKPVTNSELNHADECFQGREALNSAFSVRN